MSDIQIDCLMKKLVEVDSLHNLKRSEYREFEAILVIKQLQEKVYFIIFFIIITLLS